MRVYLDCEFNGFGGELISMGLVLPDGREWYEVLELPKDIHPWVQENVVPHLGKEPISLDDFKSSLWGFLRSVEKPHIIADWYADLIHFFNMMSGKTHAFSYPFFGIAELIDRKAELESVILHNALSDAKALMKYDLQLGK